jgi:hypothetical protein
MLPRAVGHAATLLDYFFRGRLGGQLLPPAPAGVNRRLRITNLAPLDSRSPPHAMRGTLLAFYDAADGTRVPVGRWDDQELPPDGTREVTLADPPPGAAPPAEPGRYLVVFRGQLGDEPDAVAAGWIDGRVWTLSLGVVAYDRDWTVWPILTTHPAGPTYSHSLTVHDSTLLYDGTSYAARLHERYERAQIYLWTCQGPNYSPVLLGEQIRGDWHTYQLVYRGPGVAWDDAAMLHVSAYRTLGDPEDLSPHPVTVEVVKFVPPPSPDDLQRYTYDHPPAVDAVLFDTVVATTAPPIEIGPIPLRGATLVGVRVRPFPPYPTTVPDTRRGGDLDYRCFRILQQHGELSFVWSLPMIAGSFAAAELRLAIGR